MISTFVTEIAGGNSINSYSNVLATARAGSGLGVASFLNVLHAGISYSFDGTNYTITRNWFHFDISSIPVNAIITSAFFRLPGTNTENDNVNADTIVVVKSIIASNTAVATSDWTNFNTTPFGSLPFSSYNNAANNDIALNAAGIAYLQSVLGGHAKLCIVTNNDINATTPTGYNVETANYTGLLLSITYKLPAGGGFLNRMLE